ATALGVLLMGTASLLPGAAPLLNTYLPVLDALGFFAGLLLVALAVSRLALAVLDRWRRDPGHRDWPRQLGATAAVLWLVSLGLVALEWARLVRQGTAPGAVYFEQLFWNAGHVLQFVHTVLLLACWWTLYAGTDRGRQAFLQRHRGWLLPGLVLTLAAPLLPLLAAVVDLSERTLYTAWMALSGWVLVVPFAGLLLYRLHRTGGPDPLARQVIRLSAMLYLAGAVAGSFIRGDDMLVPAHYHGVIGAVTLAYMGMIYRLLDLLGAERPERRACLAQVGLYGTGLLLLILGLAWSGWLGLARKAPEALLAAPAWSGIGTGLMTIGGAVGIAAALWFVAICIRALRTRPERGPAPAGDPAPRLDRR
ncbi:MAG: hypothetical protein R3202_15200, partial [Candidatus Competibacterales bacterium]|nr:hypothetical protein [Candidatus Competibacterales bacterium]